MLYFEFQFSGNRYCALVYETGCLLLEFDWEGYRILLLESMVSIYYIEDRCRLYTASELSTGFPFEPTAQLFIRIMRNRICCDIDSNIDSKTSRYFAKSIWYEFGTGNFCKVWMKWDRFLKQSTKRVRTHRWTGRTWPRRRRAFRKTGRRAWWWWRCRRALWQRCWPTARSPVGRIDKIICPLPNFLQSIKPKTFLAPSKSVSRKNHSSSIRLTNQWILRSADLPREPTLGSGPSRSYTRTIDDPTDDRPGAGGDADDGQQEGGRVAWHAQHFGVSCPTNAKRNIHLFIDWELGLAQLSQHLIWS